MGMLEELDDHYSLSFQCTGKAYISLFDMTYIEERCLQFTRPPPMNDEPSRKHNLAIHLIYPDFSLYLWLQLHRSMPDQTKHGHGLLRSPRSNTPTMNPAPFGFIWAYPLPQVHKKMTYIIHTSRCF